MQSATQAKPNVEYNAILSEIGEGVPDAAQFQKLSGIILEFPEARDLAKANPFTLGYKQAAMDLYLSLRGRSDEGYQVQRDEASVGGLPENVWRDLAPWSFRDAGLVSEHLLSWGAILRHLGLPKGGSLLEYGPGSGQVLLLAARLGYGAFGVDIDNTAIEGIRFQANHLKLDVEVEQGVFGEGFEGHTFDAILFYESFHHAFDFDKLLLGLHKRLNPGGRIVLCGEPVLNEPSGPIPYPWGPRLDALSVFCIRKFGWMELGFTHNFLMEMARKTGWAPTFHPFPGVGRAAVYVFERQIEDAAEPASRFKDTELRSQSGALQQELAAMRNSTSWRVTAPLRLVKTFMRRP